MVQQPEAVPVQVPGTKTVESIELDVVLASTSTSEERVPVQLVGPVPDVEPDRLETEDTDVPDLVPQEEDDSDGEAEEEEETVLQQPRCSTRIAQGILKPSKYATASVGTSVLMKEQRDAAISKAEEDKICQVFVDLKDMDPVREEDVDGKPLNCHIFTVEKF
jgi:hypothetical protein